MFTLNHSWFRHHTVNMPVLTTPEEEHILILLFMLNEIDRREAAWCDSPGAAARVAERPDVFQPQGQEVQTLVGSAMAHRTRDREERPILPASEAQVMSITDRQSFVNYLRMSVDLFNKIVHKVTPLIQTQKSNWRDPLPPALKVAVTLRHLATGDSYPSLPFNVSSGTMSITRIIPQVCRAIVECYRDKTFKLVKRAILVTDKVTNADLASPIN